MRLLLKQGVPRGAIPLLRGVEGVSCFTNIS